MSAVVESEPCPCWADGPTNHGGDHCCMRSWNPDYQRAMCGHQQEGQRVAAEVRKERAWA